MAKFGDDYLLFKTDRGAVLPLRYSKQNTDESRTANRCQHNVLLVSVLVRKKSLYLHENESLF